MDFKNRRPRWRWIALSILVGAVVVATVTPLRVSVLQSLGSSLVVDEPIASADAIVLTLDSGGAGALEAADLVQSGIATRVAVFTDPPTEEDLEFIRRGLPYEDEAARQIRQLALLGVTEVMRIPRRESGTEGEAEVLPAWCDEHRFRAIVMVSTTDHSRRLRRVMARAMDGHATVVRVRPSRYSAFDPERWWETRNGTRTGIVELQKLLLDVVLHPMQ
jgi:hypothetical protein